MAKSSAYIQTVPDQLTFKIRGLSVTFNRENEVRVKIIDLISKQEVEVGEDEIKWLIKALKDIDEVMDFSDSEN